MRCSVISMLAATVAVLGFGASSSASTITLSVFSSNGTPAEVMDATFDFLILGGNTLQLVATNDTTAPDEYNVNQVFFQASNDVSSLTLTSASHSAEGDVLSSWLPVVTDYMVDGFGLFDFGMLEGVGENTPTVIGPTESVTFLFDIAGICADTLSCTTDDFATLGELGFTVAAKFVSGPGDDSAFGAVPEPSTALLLVLGLVALAARRRS